MRLLLLLILLCCPCYAQQLHQACLANVSFSLCSNDGACTAHFFMDQFAMPYRRYKFDFLLARYMLEEGIAAEFVTPQIVYPNDTQCGSLAASPTAADVGSVFWLTIMRRADFCGVNEYFVEEHGGCQTRPGKIGSHDPPGSFTFPFYSFLLAVFVASVFIIARIEMFSREARGSYLRLASAFVQIQRFAAMAAAKQPRPQ